MSKQQTIWQGLEPQPAPKKRRARKTKTVVAPPPLPLPPPPPPPPRPVKPLTKKEQQKRARSEDAHRKMVEAEEADRYTQEQRRFYNIARAQIWAIAESDEKSGKPLPMPQGSTQKKVDRDYHGAIMRLQEVDKWIRDDILAVGGMPQAVKLYLTERRRIARYQREEKRLVKKETVRVGKYVAKV